MILTVLGTDLPGRDCVVSAGHYRDVEVGVQRGKDAEQLFAVDAASVRWAIEIEAKGGVEDLDVRGPFVQGRPGARFMYLVWVAALPDRSRSMFRRLKIPLEPTVDGPLREALLANGSATVRLALTGPDGTPRCGGIKPDALDWS